MAVYKVLQDIEAEDKLIAWLTPKQTIFAAIVIVSIVLSVAMAKISIALSVPWIIPIIIFGFLAAPLGRDQPNDIWLAAQIRFYLKQRKRVWDQSGMEELVHITVPKKLERFYTDGLSQTQVRSRLSALATTIDSRGWAVKNVAVNLTAEPSYLSGSDDRLVAANTLPQEVSISDVTEADDIMDPMSNMIAQRFDAEIKRQQVVHKNQLINAVHKTAAANNQQATNQPEDFYFMQQSEVAATPQAEPLAVFSPQLVAPGAGSADNTFLSDSVGDDIDAAAQALLDKIHHDKEVEKEIAESTHEMHIKTPEDIAAEERVAAKLRAEEHRKVEEARVAEERRQAAERARARESNAIIKELSHNSDFSVATIAKQAQRAAGNGSLQDGEEISLH